MDSLVLQRGVGGGRVVLCALPWFAASIMSDTVLYKLYDMTMTYNFFISTLYSLETFSIFVKLCTKVLQPFESLLLFRLYGLLLCELAVVVNGTCEGC